MAGQYEDPRMRALTAHAGAELGDPRA